MAWDPSTSSDIEGLFSSLSVPDTEEEGWLVEGRAPDTVEVRARRERRRAAKMEADPEYAERRREQARESYHRNKKAKPRTATSRPTVYRCGACGGLGHNKRTCGS